MVLLGFAGVFGGAVSSSIACNEDKPGGGGCSVVELIRVLARDVFVSLMARCMREMNNGGL